MSDATGESAAGAGGEPDGAGRPGPHRVIGTPPPAQARTLLGADVPDAAAIEPRELPADPADPSDVAYPFVMARAKRVERIVAACFLLAMVAGIGFLLSYVFIPDHSVSNVAHSNLALGSCLGVALLLLGVGAVLWVRHLMPWVEISENRHPLRSDPEERAAFAKTFSEGAEASQFVKRPMLRRTLIAATVPLGLAPVLLLRDMGPLPGTYLRTTVWRKGIRLLKYGPNTPIKAEGFDSAGGLVPVIPEGYAENFDALAKAAVIIIKFAPGQLVWGKNPNEIEPGTTVRNWTVENIVAYSKICTHVGCPVALYEQTTHHILCPCHQSTFDATRGAQVVFGPATRPLPQLPITTDAEGYLVANGHFAVPVGPSFWERG